MSKPVCTILVEHDPRWAEQARREAAAVRKALGPLIWAVHHIGSTAIPTIKAIPILDFLPVVESLGALDRRLSTIEDLGYEWSGEFGLTGRRYCRLGDPATGDRLVQAHFYEQGSSEIVRHLAFRDHLCRDEGTARAYEAVKCNFAQRHPNKPQAYGRCKSAWIDAAESKALAGS